MTRVLDLDNIQMMIHHQAVEKKWKTEAKFCAKRAKVEIQELKDAIENGESPKEIAKEGIDVIYFIVQAVLDSAPNISLNDAFLEKYEENWVKKKKTEDEHGNPVLR